MVGTGALGLRGEATGVGLGHSGTGKALGTLHCPTLSYEIIENMKSGFSQCCKEER